MLPPAHIEFSWAALNLLQRRAGLFADADYRLVALSAVLPDLIDKPLATFVMTEANAALLFGHTALLHGATWLAAAGTGRLGRWAPYLLAFSGHLVGDRMWGFAQTLLWPLRGRRFHQWKHVGSPEAILQAYRDIIRQEPKLVAFEVAGLALFAWFVADRKLWRQEALARFVKEGRWKGGSGERRSEVTDQRSEAQRDGPGM